MESKLAAAKPAKPVRVELRLPVAISIWLNEQARQQTAELGGAVRKGGNGIVTTSHIITSLVNAEIKRAEKAGKK